MLLSKFRSLISYHGLYDRLMALFLYFDFQLCLNHLFQLNVCNAYIFFLLVNVNSHSVASIFFSFLFVTIREMGVLGVSIKIFCDHFLPFHFYVFSFLLPILTFSIESVIFLYFHYQHFSVLGNCVNYCCCC